MTGEPRTEVRWYDQRVLFDATRSFGPREIRARIVLYPWDGNGARVKFHWRYPDAEHKSSRQWSSSVTGGLGANTKLNRWLQLATVLYDAVDLMTETLTGPVTDEQRTVYENYNDTPHPVQS